GLPCSSTIGSPFPTSTNAISLPRTRSRFFWYGNAAEIRFVSITSSAEVFMDLIRFRLKVSIWGRCSNAKKNFAFVLAYVAGGFWDAHWTLSKSGSYQGVSDKCSNARARGGMVENRRCPSTPGRSLFPRNGFCRGAVETAAGQEGSPDDLV